MIDIQPLAILREIDRTSSLTQAADKLNLTQSAVSHAIRRFEERHGVKLWEREGHKLRLTLTGEYLLGLAMRVLPQLEYGAMVLEDYARGRRDPGGNGMPPLPGLADAGGGSVSGGMARCRTGCDHGISVRRAGRAFES
ncbi:LysR family transcriptional regulator [Paenirhodobacter sp.]|uniref:LysR family transcriptional regulator n=1 Tax=Paenirhodobacter sp. TaxID=1965326 RepID=UPI003B3DC131